MNKHVLLILKWLKNPESVSKKELEGHYDLLDYQDYPVFHGTPDFEIEQAYTFIYFGDYNEVPECIEEYFRLSGESRDDYEEAILVELQGLGEEDMKGGNLSDVS